MFESIFNLVDIAINDNIANITIKLIDVIKPLLGACIVLYAVVLSYKALYDSQNLMVMESVNFIIKLALVSSIALSATYYIDTLAPILLNIGDDIASQITGGGAATNTIQVMFSETMDRITAMIERTSLDWTSSVSWQKWAIKWLSIIMILIGAIPFIAISFIYLLVAKIMMSFLLIIGPIFLMMSIFPSTRSYFQAWTGQCFNYALLTLVYPLAFSLFHAILNFGFLSRTPSFAMSGFALIIYIGLILASLQIPSFCSSLSGGVGISGLVGSLNSLGRTGSKGAGLFGKGAGLAGKGIAKTTKGAGKIFGIGKGKISAG
ncbi:type IV secretion system protein [uncultured Shewanella sp.]|uniref:type IV secretion system protein n=1 Tax=uncultured Shewanella sp. TaxID=173975 RepID=UPI00260AFDC3|nr:type IV secretion system protein [uncultured Shewanella sp.]